MEKSEESEDEGSEYVLYGVVVGFVSLSECSEDKSLLMLGSNEGEVCVLKVPELKYCMKLIVEWWLDG